MKITDLRIGNIVNDEDNQPMYIAGLWPVNNGKQYRFIDSAGNTGDVSKICSGIPLTEELLLKMGFEDFDVIYSKSPDLVISKDLEWVGIYNTHLEDDIHYDCPKYIHQLQNLTFILTGQELTLS